MAVPWVLRIARGVGLIVRMGMGMGMRMGKLGVEVEFVENPWNGCVGASGLRSIDRTGGVDE